MRIVTAEVAQDSTLGDEEAKERGVRLEEFGAVHGEDINGGEFRDVLNQDTPVGTLGFRRSIAKKIRDSFSGSGQREIWLSFARSKDSLNAERGVATLEAPHTREQQSWKMAMWREQSSDKTLQKVTAKRSQERDSIRMCAL